MKKHMKKTTTHTHTQRCTEFIVLYELCYFLLFANYCSNHMEITFSLSVIPICDECISKPDFPSLNLQRSHIRNPVLYLVLEAFPKWHCILLTIFLFSIYSKFTHIFSIQKICISSQTGSCWVAEVGRKRRSVFVLEKLKFQKQIIFSIFVISLFFFSRGKQIKFEKQLKVRKFQWGGRIIILSLKKHVLMHLLRNGMYNCNNSICWVSGTPFGTPYTEPT